MSIRVIAQTNPFKTERDMLEYEVGLSIEEICTKLKIDLEESEVRCSIDGEPVFDFTEIPEEETLVLIKVIPNGDAISDNNIGQNILGFVLIAAGVVAIATGVGAGAGIALMAMGAGTLFGEELDASVKAMSELATGSADYVRPQDPKANYLSGGRNSIKPDGNVPVILGRNRCYPYQVALPFTEFSTGNTYDVIPASGRTESVSVASRYTQKLHQVYLWGHKEVEVDPSTFKRGDNLISSLSETKFAFNSTPYYGDESKKFLNVGKSLKKYVRDTTSSNAGFSEVQVILPSQIKELKPTFLLGSFFFIKEDSEGNAVGTRPYTWVRIKFWDVEDPETIIYNYAHIINGQVVNPGDPTTPTSVTLDMPPIPDPTKQYVLSVTRLMDDPTDNPEDHPDAARDTLTLRYDEDVISYQIDLVLSHIEVTGVKDVLSADAVSAFNYTDLLITDLAKDGAEVDVVTGEVDNFNAIVTTNIPVYSGSGTGASSWTNKALTSNPAALFLYVLQGAPNKRPVSDNLIDWRSLEEWYTFCEDNSYECHLVLDNPGTIESILTLICFAGRAALQVGDTYGVIVDQPRIAPTQMFTNKNSFGLTTNRTLERDVHAIEYSFIDEGENKDVFQSTTGWIYREGYNADGSDGKIKATLNQAQNIVGITNGDQVNKILKYQLNCAERRIDTLSVSMDVEYVLCQRGDLVTVSYDELLQGLARGRCRDIVFSGTDVTSIVMDETVVLESGKDYAIIVRTDTGDQTIPITVINTEDETNTLTLVTPGPYPIKAGDLYIFGEAGNSKEDYIVLDITPGADLTATISLTNYAPEVYDLGTLPPFESKVSLPANFGFSQVITDIYNSDDITIVNKSDVEQINTVVSPSLINAIRSNIPSASLIRDDALEVKLSELYLYFISRDDMKLYRSTFLPSATRELVIDDEIKEFDVAQDDSAIVYSSFTSNNNLYLYDVEEDTTTQITDVLSTQPVFMNQLEVGYINVTQGNKIYKTDFNDSSEGTLISDFPTTSMGIYNDWIVWMDPETEYVYRKDIHDGDLTYRGEVYKRIPARCVQAVSPGIWYQNNVGAVPLFIDGVNQISYIEETPYYGDVSRHCMNTAGDYVFVTPIGDAYYVSLVGAGQQATLDAEVAVDLFDIPCSLVENDVQIRNISVDDIDSFSWNDDITGTGIEEGTKVTFVGSTYVMMDKPATQTISSASVTVKGTRLVLNANKVIVPGSIQAGLLATDAINSIDRVGTGLPNEGEQLYQHNLETGVEKQYNNQGELIRQFTPEDGLWLREGVLIGGTAPGEGTPVPNDPSFTDTINTIYRQNSAPTLGLIENDQWFDTDDNLLYARKSGSWQLVGPASLGDLDGNANTKLNNIEEGATQNNIYTVNTASNLPVTANDGDLAIVTDVDDLFKWDTSAWFKISDATPGYLNNGGAVGYNGGSGTSWGIDSNGKLTCSGASITGTLEVGTESAGGNFKIEANGDVTCNNLTASGASIQGNMEALSTDGLARTIVDDGSVEFFVRNLDTDPWSSAGRIEGGFDAGETVLQVPQDFRIGLMTVGLGGGQEDTNLAVGIDSLKNNTSGVNNISLGTNALPQNTIGSRNIGIGVSALAENISGNLNIAIGIGALSNTETASENIAIGDGAMRGNLVDDFTGIENIAIGKESLDNLTSGRNNIAIGSVTATVITSGSDNVCVGSSAGKVLSTGDANVAVGVNALGRFITGGVSTGSYNTAVGTIALNTATSATTNSTGLGYGAQVTGSNQVQLGNSSTTTYAYGAVQNRSDRRDKTDIVETDLGLDFINKLTPVKFKWDYREDYIEYDLKKEQIRKLPKDGSKKRSRAHQGFIAQEVKEVMNMLGVDFAGYQDHSISGGKDVLSLGYTEFIAPIVKAIQELSEKVEELTK